METYKVNLADTADAFWSRYLRWDEAANLGDAELADFLDNGGLPAVYHYLPYARSELPAAGPTAWRPQVRRVLQAARARARAPGSVRVRPLAHRAPRAPPVRCSPAPRSSWRRP
jgi:hypothetical protein